MVAQLTQMVQQLWVLSGRMDMEWQIWQGMSGSGHRRLVEAIMFSAAAVGSARPLVQSRGGAATPRTVCTPSSGFGRAVECSFNII